MVPVAAVRRLTRLVARGLGARHLCDLVGLDDERWFTVHHVDGHALGHHVSPERPGRAEANLHVDDVQPSGLPWRAQRKRRHREAALVLPQIG